MVVKKVSSALLGLFLITTVSRPCSVVSTKMPSNVQLVRSADAVIRAKVIEYAASPANPRVRTTGVPDSMVRFKVEEVIRGLDISDLALPGYVVQQDDFNNQQSPYTSARPGALSGSCFANSYREGAEYLLLLKKSAKTGELTVNWAALAPVNEQLHSSNDPWLLWVRQQAEPRPKPPQ